MKEFENEKYPGGIVMRRPNNEKIFFLQLNKMKLLQSKFDIEIKI